MTSPRKSQLSRGEEGMGKQIRARILASTVAIATYQYYSIVWRKKAGEYFDCNSVDFPFRLHCFPSVAAQTPPPPPPPPPPTPLPRPRPSASREGKGGVCSPPQGIDRDDGRPPYENPPKGEGVESGDGY
jgi:hypothetical protein